MKITLQMTGMIVGGLIAGAFVFYMIFGFFAWITSDPFNWIPEGASVSPKEDSIPSLRQINLVDIENCRKQGGFAVLSSWDSSLKKCEFKDK